MMSDDAKELRAAGGSEYRDAQLYAIDLVRMMPVPVSFDRS